MASKRARFKISKIMIGRDRYGDYLIGTEKSRQRTRYQPENFKGFSRGLLAGFCAKEFHKIFPHLKLEKGEGPLLVGVSAKLLKMPKKKSKKRV